MNNKGLHFETNLVMNPVKGVSLFQKQKNNAYVVIFTNFHVSKMQKKKKKKKEEKKNGIILFNDHLENSDFSKLAAITQDQRPRILNRCFSTG